MVWVKLTSWSLIINVQVLGGGLFGRWLSHEARALSQEQSLGGGLFALLPSGTSTWEVFSEAKAGA